MTAKSTNSGLKNPVNTSRVVEVFHVPTVVQLQTYSHISRHAPRRPDMICVCVLVCRCGPRASGSIDVPFLTRRC